MTASPATDRGVSPAIGTITLVLLTILLAAVGTSVVGSTPLDTASPPQSVAISATADDTGRITVSHRGGPPIDVESTTLHVSVDGRPLATQPPVPFFSTSGFEPGPTGAFNSASDPRLRVGDTASFTVAGTNAPAVTVGSTVEVQVLRDDRVLASAETSVDRRPGDGDEG
ncbi:hypothetical protein HSRCO_2889 [Halanaeroarchaeum sp. HSR-CO]|uniref:type IV pilin n=1 Tax=Halanaeroarchaeum sp. HSR-CO TaxID=2866382 RepID=UPI00217E92E9|nr:type IV pilin [Halanaeroarchaeum sp. HSR-CO]UWG46634.1 hypothetical protein HSRCO_2889 [Halanaeroarchaeum sp. HSR-CO]